MQIKKVRICLQAIFWFFSLAQTFSSTNVEIIGTREYKQQVIKALELLEKKSPEAYLNVCKYVGRIVESERSGMLAYNTPPTYEMSKVTALYSVSWCAATIAHDSFHSKLYHDYQKEHNGPVPPEIWTGIKIEQICMKYQLKVMEQIEAPKAEIEHAEKRKDGRYSEVDYKNRNW